MEAEERASLLPRCIDRSRMIPLFAGRAALDPSGGALERAGACLILFVPKRIAGSVNHAASKSLGDQLIRL